MHLKIASSPLGFLYSANNCVKYGLVLTFSATEMSLEQCISRGFTKGLDAWSASDLALPVPEETAYPRTILLGKV
jgi:hypothetical protein